MESIPSYSQWSALIFLAKRNSGYLLEMARCETRCHSTRCRWTSPRRQIESGKPRIFSVYAEFENPWSVSDIDKECIFTSQIVYESTVLFSWKKIIIILCLRKIMHLYCTVLSTIPSFNCSVILYFTRPFQNNCHYLSRCQLDKILGAIRYSKSSPHPHKNCFWDVCGLIQAWNNNTSTIYWG